MKTCKTCKQSKSEDQFFFRIKSEGKRQASCRGCWKKKRRGRYHKDGVRARQKVKERKAELQKWFRELKAGMRCAKCGEDHPAAIQFHHTNPAEKDIDVAAATNRGWSKERILKEIKKCAILCANCHAKVHYAAVV